MRQQILGMVSRPVHGTSMARHSMLASSKAWNSLTLGMSAPDDQTSPSTKRSKEVEAAAKGPAKETSNMSVLFLTKLLN